jgi:hypothetical protein
MLSTNKKAGIDEQVMKMDMKMVKMDMYVGVFFSELDEKYVFKYVLSDDSRLEGVVICLDGEKIDFRYSSTRVMIVFCFFDKIDNKFFIMSLMIHVANDT